MLRSDSPFSQRSSCFADAGRATVWNSVRPGTILVSSSLVAQVTRPRIGASHSFISPSGSSVCWMRMDASPLSEIQRLPEPAGDAVPLPRLLQVPVVHVLGAAHEPDHVIPRPLEVLAHVEEAGLHQQPILEHHGEVVHQHVRFDAHPVHHHRHVSTLRRHQAPPLVLPERRAPSSFSETRTSVYLYINSPRPGQRAAAPPSASGS